MTRLQMCFRKLLLGVMLVVICGCSDYIKPDKVGHFIVGAFISGLVTSAAGRHNHGIAAACVAGAAKEIYDLNTNGQVEFADFVYTCAGGSAGLLIE